MECRGVLQVKTFAGMRIGRIPELVLRLSGDPKSNISPRIDQKIDAQMNCRQEKTLQTSMFTGF